MFVVVQHSLQDPAAWRNMLQVSSTKPNLGFPEHVRPIQYLPDRELTRATCLWQAESVESLRQVLEPALGRISRNEYYAVDTDQAIGLPG